MYGYSLEVQHVKFIYEIYTLFFLFFLLGSTDTEVTRLRRVIGTVNNHRLTPTVPP